MIKPELTEKISLTVALALLAFAVAIGLVALLCPDAFA